ncbi:MAG: hypothetical protein QM759_17950 [Terricaulis sp.]
MRLALAGFVFVGLAAVATAQQPAPASQHDNPEVLDRVYACATITDEHQRLACYDAAVGTLHEAQNRGDVVAVDRQQAERVNREAFGFSLPSLPNLFGGGHHGERAAVAPLTAQDMTIQSVQRLGNGRALFTMSNGQVWLQIDDENSRNARQGGEVTVRTAAMGSFLMSVKAGGPALRVRRQQ